MKVLHISTSDLGGAGIAAVRLHKAMLDEGVDSHLLTLHQFRADVPKHTRYMPGDGKLLPAFFNLIYKIKRGLNYYGLLRFRHSRMSRKHLKNRPVGFEHFSFPVSEINLLKHPLVKEADVIHLHWVSDGFIDYSSFFRNSRKKIFWTLHDMNPFTGGCHHSDDCMKFKEDCKPCIQLKGTIDDNFAAVMLKKKKAALLNIDKNQISIITPSKWMGALSSQSALFRNYQHHVIPNVIDTDTFNMLNKTEARESLGLPLYKKIILFNSHHIDNPRKGLKYLIDAMKLSTRNDILLCASGNIMNTETQVSFINLGYLNSESKMAQAYAAADVFVLPSVAENFPNTLCEAILCGTPVVAFNVGGVSEIINSDNGILVTLKDSSELAKAIDRVVDSNKYDKDIIRRDALKRFNSSKIINDHIILYSK